MMNLPVEGNPVDWSAIRNILQPGMQIDVQFADAEAPINYTVVMVLDSQIIFCRLVDEERLPEVEGGETPMVFIPTLRDFYSARMLVEKSAENGRYIALSPSTNAQFLRRRRTIRIKAPENISYRIQFDGKSSIYKGIAVQDVGRGGIGLLVYAASPIQEGLRTQVEITIPKSNEQVAAVGKVSHCIPYGTQPRIFRIGIQFTTISPRDKQAISMYIDHHLARQRKKD